EDGCNVLARKLFRNRPIAWVGAAYASPTGQRIASQSALFVRSVALRREMNCPANLLHFSRNAQHFSWVHELSFAETGRTMIVRRVAISSKPGLPNTPVPASHAAHCYRRLN